MLISKYHFIKTHGSGCAIALQTGEAASILELLQGFSTFALRSMGDLGPWL